MTVGANSYGTADGVSVRCGQYVDDTLGVFTTTTHPTKAQAETFINQLSGVMNTALSKAGFSIPVSQSDAVQAITGIVEEYAADLVLATGMQGRFYSESFVRSGMNRMAFISKEINEWVIAAADGLENMGAPRDTGGGANSLQAGVIVLDIADHNETVY
jgi:hypothetical protein